MTATSKTIVAESNLGVGHTKRADGKWDVANANVWQNRDTSQPATLENEAIKHTGNMHVGGAVSLGSVDVAGSSNANVNVTQCSEIRFTDGGSVSGFAGAYKGQLLYVLNASTTTLSLLNNDAGSAVGSRIMTPAGATLSLLPNQSVALVYDGVSVVWRVASALQTTQAFSLSAVLNTVQQADVQVGSRLTYQTTQEQRGTHVERLDTQRWKLKANKTYRMVAITTMGDVPTDSWLVLKWFNETTGFFIGNKAPLSMISARPSASVATVTFTPVVDTIVSVRATSKGSGTINIDPSAAAAWIETVGDTLPVEVPASGNACIAVQNNVSQAAGVLLFDGIKLRCYENDVEISVTAGYEAVMKILIEHEYPGGSSGSWANISWTDPVTTAWVKIGDQDLIDGERAVITIRNELTGRLYHATVWKHNVLDGNWSGWVTRIGANQPAPAGNILNVAIVTGSEITATGISASSNATLTFNYTPVSATSKLIIEWDADYSIDGAGADSWRGTVTIDGLGVMSKMQTFNGSTAGGGTRGSVMTPIMCVFNNTNTNAKSIGLDMTRVTGDDTITLNNNRVCKITEISGA